MSRRRIRSQPTSDRCATDPPLRDESLPQHDECWNDARWRRRVRRRLLDWFSTHARSLPWRSDPSPYKVWVSEIMLQQTQVATVIPYFERFIRRFPTVEDLAQADEPTLLSLWEGLGYYRRARSLQAAARMVVEQHDGRFPETFAEAIALPGIGRYTAGAILSISRDQRLPVLEGNTKRVFSRWAAVRGGNESATTGLLWEIATAMLPRRKPGTFNQAAMELGALVCRVKNPSCGDCPIRSECRAAELGLQEVIPGKVTKIRYEARTEFALVIRERFADRSDAVGDAAARYLVRPLPEDGRWGGLWDFPRTTQDSHESVESAAAALGDQIGTAVAAGDRLKTIKHAVTKYRIALHVHRAVIDGSAAPTQPWRYASLQELADLPMSVTGRKIVEMLSNDA